MKQTRLIVVILALLTGPILLYQGCASAAKVSYQTISATEQAVLSANAAYLDAVVSHQIPTNGVPAVERAFNDTQMALHAAAVVASGGNNAPVPPAVKNQADSFITLTKKP